MYNTDPKEWAKTKCFKGRTCNCSTVNCTAWHKVNDDEGWCYLIFGKDPINLKYEPMYLEHSVSADFKGEF